VRLRVTCLAGKRILDGIGYELIHNEPQRGRSSVSILVLRAIETSFACGNANEVATQLHQIGCSIDLFDSVDFLKHGIEAHARARARARGRVCCAGGHAILEDKKTRLPTDPCRPPRDVPIVHQFSGVGLAASGRRPGLAKIVEHPGLDRGKMPRSLSSRQHQEACGSAPQPRDQVCPRPPCCTTTGVLLTADFRSDQHRGAALGPEVLCQFQSLRLVIRANRLAIEPCGSGEHPLVDQAADDLTMLENERHLARTHFKHGARATTTGVRMAEARIEKTGTTVLSRCSPSVWVGGSPIIGLNSLKQAILLAMAVSLSLHGAGHDEFRRCRPGVPI
jgi:hypothetical protein